MSKFYSSKGKRPNERKKNPPKTEGAEPSVSSPPTSVNVDASDPTKSVLEALATHLGFDPASFLNFVAQTGPGIGGVIVKKRQEAVAAIETLSSMATAGEQLALKALYNVAVLATSNIERQSESCKKQLARSVMGWPVVLSNNRSFNEDYLNGELYSLELSADVELIVKPDALGTKPNFLKEIVARIVAVIAGWKNEQVDRDVLEKIGDLVRAQGFGKDAVRYSENRQREVLVEEMRLTTQKLQSLAQLLDSKLPIETSRIDEMRIEAIRLPAPTPERKVQTQWFALLMDVLETLTAGRYELKRHGLRYWGGIPYVDEKTDNDLQTDLRANIRDQMKKQLHRMLTVNG